MAANNQIIRIEPSVLTWARESLGLTVAEVAAKLDKDRETVQQWEHGKSSPTFAQLEKLAYSVYKRPLAVFFLPKPPKETTPKQDFRTLPDREIKNLSPELRLIIRKAKYNQLVLKQLNDGVNPLESPIHKAFQLRITNNPANTANRLREYLGITKRLQQSFKNSEDAFNYYRNLLEKNGIYVFQYPLSEARGFSLMDREFPVIVLNSKDKPNGKIFSLFHELCHILFNTGGVFRDYYTEELKQNPDRIEIFCNKFASDFLLPTEELLDEPIVLNHGEKKEWSDDQLQSVANTYKVSKEVVLRKLLEAGKTTQTFYLKMRNVWKEAYQKANETKKPQEGGPSFHVVNLSHLGKNFVTRVLTSYHTGKITESQVADFLGIKISKIPEYVQKVF
jgi:Zn-dependent peptidase ImmA (M78 family)/transcriptional regulator with XRE-family HTH domain